MVEAAQWSAEECYPTVIDRLQPEYRSDKRGFPAAVGPETCDQLTGFDSEGYVLEHVLAVELDAEALDLNDARVQLHAWPALRVSRFDSMTEM